MAGERDEGGAPAGAVEAGTGHRGPGRPRSARADQAILDSAASLLREVGYDSLSIAQVARRAGVGRQTVYRRWPSKGALIAAATLNGAVDVQRPKVAQTPDLPRDLESWLMALAAGWGTTEEASLVRALSAAAADDATIAAELYLRLTGPQHDALVSRMRAAQEAGDVTADADIEAAADALIGGLLYVVLARHESVTRQRARGLLTIVLSGLQREP